MFVYELERLWVQVPPGIGHVLRKDFLDIQTNTECKFTVVFVLNESPRQAFEQMLFINLFIYFFLGEMFHLFANLSDNFMEFLRECLGN